MEGCRLTLGASRPPGMPRDGADAQVPLRGQGLGRWERHGGHRGLQPSVLNRAGRGGCLSHHPARGHSPAPQGCRELALGFWSYQKEALSAFR